MVSFFYPTPAHPRLSICQLAPDFLPKTAVYLDNFFGVPSGSAESVISQSHSLALISDPAHSPFCSSPLARESLEHCTQVPPRILRARLYRCYR
jgi:hypothetical protein